MISSYHKEMVENVANQLLSALKMNTGLDRNLDEELGVASISAETSDGVYWIYVGYYGGNPKPYSVDIMITPVQDHWFLTLSWGQRLESLEDFELPPNLAAIRTLLVST